MWFMVALLVLIFLCGHFAGGWGNAFQSYLNQYGDEPTDEAATDGPSCKQCGRELLPAGLFKVKRTYGPVNVQCGFCGAYAER